MMTEEWCAGFETAMEMALTEANESRTLEEARARIREYVGSTKGRKFEKIRQELAVTRLNRASGAPRQ